MATEDLLDSLSGLVHEPSQVHDGGVDVTVDEIYEVTEAGRVDFGGGEVEDADLSPHRRIQRNESDEYEWWHLEAGTYLLEYNETLDAEDPRLLQARDVVLERGGSHPTLRVETLPRIPLTVGGDGLRLKENARVSTLHIP